jgi:phage tail-like protein
MTRATRVLLVCLVVGFAALSNVVAAEFAATRSTVAMGAAAGQRRDLVENFRFRIVFDGRTVAGFEEVSVADAASPDVDGYRGGYHMPVQKLPPGYNKASDVIMKRGVVQDQGFEDWLDGVRSLQAGKDVQIGLYDQTGHLRARYLVHRARVSKIAAPGHNGHTNADAIDALVLATDGVELLPCEDCAHGAASTRHGP